MQTGQKAPDFSLKSQNGSEISLKDFPGKTLVIFFYPKDGTMICTKEACAFRDNIGSFQELGAEVIGVSSDDTESHSGFAREHGLSYPLLSDPGGQVAKLFEVKKTLGIAPGRTTFVIDPEGVIRHVYSSQLSAGRHVDEALAAVRRIKSAS
jgi:peroxiredoxin Q/BCP